MKIEHPHMLTYLQKFSKRWHGLAPHTFNTSLKCVFDLHVMLKKHLKKPKWLES